MATQSSPAARTPFRACAAAAPDTSDFCKEWNAENQLVKVEKNGAEAVRFAYDPSGRRVEKVAGATTTGYTYDGKDVLRTVRGSASSRYVFGDAFDEPLAVDDGVSASYFHADALSSVVKRTDAGGAVSFTAQYDAWGRPEAAVDQSGYAFTGREWDSESGLYYYRARYYDPAIGAFVSEDSIDFRDGLSRFSYVMGRPTVLIDPSGHIPCGRDCPSDVKQAAKDACNFANTIPDARIRRCMRDKCPIVDIKCHPTNTGPCKGATGPAYSTLEGPNTITICSANPVPEGGCYKRIIIHEMYDHLCRPAGPYYGPGDYEEHERRKRYLGAGAPSGAVQCP